MTAGQVRGSVTFRLNNVLAVAKHFVNSIDSFSSVMCVFSLHSDISQYSALVAVIGWEKENN